MIVLWHRAKSPVLMQGRRGEPRCYLVGVSLPGICPHERCFRQLMAFGGALHVLTRCARPDGEPLRVKRQQA
jgi:hypothetical protein